MSKKYLWFGLLSLLAMVTFLAACASAASQPASVIQLTPPEANTPPSPVGTLVVVTHTPPADLSQWVNTVLIIETGSAETQIALRTGPGLEYPVVRYLASNTNAGVRGTSGNWALIHLNDGTQGWVILGVVQPYSVQTTLPTLPTPPIMTSAAPTDTPALATAVPMVTLVIEASSSDTQITLRTGPGEGYSVIRYVATDTPAFVFGKSGEWVLVALTDGTQGWVTMPVMYPPSTGGIIPELAEPPIMTPVPSVTPPPTATFQPHQIQLTAEDGGNVTLRLSPDSNGTVLAWVASGTWVTVTGITSDGDWAQVTYQDYTAYVSALIVSPAERRALPTVTP